MNMMTLRFEKEFKEIKKDIYYPMINKIKKSTKNSKNFYKNI